MKCGATPTSRRSVIDMYYDGMPEAIGFVNGYGAGYTYTRKKADHSCRSTTISLRTVPKPMPWPTCRNSPH